MVIPNEAYPPIKNLVEIVSKLNHCVPNWAVNGVENNANF
jgi:hypothetical protein